MAMMSGDGRVHGHDGGNTWNLIETFREQRTNGTVDQDGRLGTALARMAAATEKPPGCDQQQGTLPVLTVGGRNHGRDRPLLCQRRSRTQSIVHATAATQWLDGPSRRCPV